MGLKVDFVARASAQGAKLAPLCREFGISRQTGHKWLKRFKAQGFDGLEEASRRPTSTPLSTAEEVVAKVLEERARHPTWGARKLTPVLRRTLGESAPSEATVARIVKRFGMVKERRLRRVRCVTEQSPCVDVKSCNDLWTVDHKGYWRSGDQRRCEPLTVRDAHSRLVLTTKLLCGTAAEVRLEMQRLFKKYGLPRAIQCDNGSPFVSTTARGGLTKLSAWWVSLGIQFVRSRPGSPQDNGAHERMHRDIAREVEVRPADTLEAQQVDLDKWKQTFNSVRPHEALGGRTPSEVYRKSERRPVERTPNYDSRFITRRVGREGHFWFGDSTYFLSSSLAGQIIALEPLGGLKHRAWFFDVDLGTIELLSRSAEKLIGPRKERRAA